MPYIFSNIVRISCLETTAPEQLNIFAHAQFCYEAQQEQWLNTKRDMLAVRGISEHEVRVLT
jgi:hypothetical protein